MPPIVFSMIVNKSKSTSSLGSASVRFINPLQTVCRLCLSSGKNRPFKCCNHKRSVGNHEVKLLQMLKKPQQELTIKELHFLENVKKPEWLAGIVSKFPFWIDTGRELLLHAGLEPGKKSLEEMNKRDNFDYKAME